MSQETITLTLYQVKQTEKAYLFSTQPAGAHNRKEEQHWIPKSQIEHISRDKSLGDAWPKCEVRMTLWIAEQKGLA